METHEVTVKSVDELIRLIDDLPENTIIHFDLGEEDEDDWKKF